MPDFFAGVMAKFLADKTSADLIWIGVGFGGQFLFSMRFIYQWLRSEQAKKSIIPVPFWYFSFFGGLTLLAYSIRQQDIVFMVGQASGLLIYGRNIALIWREQRLNREERLGAPAE